LISDLSSMNANLTTQFVTLLMPRYRTIHDPMPFIHLMPPSGALIVVMVSIKPAMPGGERFWLVSPGEVKEVARGPVTGSNVIPP